MRSEWHVLEASHSFICHPHVYPRMEWIILPSFRKHSPDGGTRARQRTSDYSSVLIYRPWKDERLSWPSWLTYSGWFTHISGHPSAACRAYRTGKVCRSRSTFYHCATQPTGWQKCHPDGKNSPVTLPSRKETEKKPAKVQILLHGPDLRGCDQVFYKSRPPNSESCRRQSRRHLSREWPRP